MTEKLVYVLNGPNLNLLGTRQPEIYGSETLADLERACVEHGARLGLTVLCRQSNHEGALVDWVHEAKAKGAVGAIINGAGYTGSSYALLDAILSTGLKVVEVHISNIYRREEFRHYSYVARGAVGGIFGLGTQGYLLALDALARQAGAAARG
ncbi:MAG: 3-dehydroquinate dehydratase [Alphaproteobacteria bacterium]|nr:3-dehydroquinate dehydratase [Alphaproteobacteria bacterium]